MAQHIQDGRVWAVDKRTGEKRRVKRHIIRYSAHLVLAPAERAKGVSTQDKPKQKRKARRKTVTEPTTAEAQADAATDEPDSTEPEPDTTEPVTAPESTENKE